MAKPDRENVSPMRWPSNQTVLECNRYMFENKIMTDIAFKVLSEHFEAHKYMILSRCPVFYVIFCAHGGNKCKPVNIPDTEPGAFEQFLTYLYTEDAALTPNLVPHVLQLAERYKLTPLAEKCARYMQLRNEQEVANGEKAPLLDKNGIHDGPKAPGLGEEGIKDGKKTSLLNKKVINDGKTMHLSDKKKDGRKKPLSAAEEIRNGSVSLENLEKTRNKLLNTCNAYISEHKHLRAEMEQRKKEQIHLCVHLSTGGRGDEDMERKLLSLQTELNTVEQEAENYQEKLRDVDYDLEEMGRAIEDNNGMVEHLERAIIESKALGVDMEARLAARLAERDAMLDEELASKMVFQALEVKYQEMLKAKEHLATSLAARLHKETGEEFEEARGNLEEDNDCVSPVAGHESLTSNELLADALIDLSSDDSFSSVKSINQ